MTKSETSLATHPDSIASRSKGWDQVCVCERGQLMLIRAFHRSLNACGFETFQHERPCDPSTLPRWRKKVGEETILKMFSATLEVAKKNDFCEPKTVSA